MMKTLIALVTMLVIMTIGLPVTAAETGGHDLADRAQASPMILKLHERMLAIQQQMEIIHATENVNERHRLIHEHMQSMRDAMVMMHTMPQGTEDDDCVGQRMEVMRMMTDQMKEHQRVEEAQGEQR